MKKNEAITTGGPDSNGKIAKREHSGSNAGPEDGCLRLQSSTLPVVGQPGQLAGSGLEDLPLSYTPVMGRPEEFGSWSPSHLVRLPFHLLTAQGSRGFPPLEKSWGTWDNPMVGYHSIIAVSHYLK